MNNLSKFLIIIALASSASCAFYFTLPLSAYHMMKGVEVGTPALPYYAYSNTSLEVINTEFKNAKAKVTIEDVYTYGYGKSFKGLPPDGDTGQKFNDMTTATRYLQNVIKAKGVSEPQNYFMTSIDSAKDFGFALIAAVYRPEEKIVVRNKFGASNDLSLTCDDPPYYQPYRFDCNGKPLDTVYEWGALPNDCFDKQGHQAILLTLMANKILEKQVKDNYWDAERKWIGGDYKSVIIAQDYMVCQELGIEKGYTQEKNIFKE
ncbi:MAG: hypothetical protein C4518_05265 [Desulfobacteraceae bacterium]|nr:MAG: hypothetical protein C4518_05265 [Desulfobacteraceae bacterium]